MSRGNVPYAINLWRNRSCLEVPGGTEFLELAETEYDTLVCKLQLYLFPQSDRLSSRVLGQTIF